MAISAGFLTKCTTRADGDRFQPPSRTEEIGRYFDDLSPFGKPHRAPACVVLPFGVFVSPEPGAEGGGPVPVSW